jgi:hypothetical protein
MRGLSLGLGMVARGGSLPYPLYLTPASTVTSADVGDTIGTIILRRYPVLIPNQTTTDADVADAIGKIRI